METRLSKFTIPGTRLQITQSFSNKWIVSYELFRVGRRRLTIEASAVSVAAALRRAYAKTSKYIESKNPELDKT